MLGNLDRTGKMWARIGVIVLAFGMGMSFEFGRQMTYFHAAFLAGLTFLAAFGPEAAYKAYQEGKKASGLVIALGAALLLTIQLGVDSSYTASIRGVNRDEATVQNARYDGAQDGVKEAKASLALFEKRLVDLEAANGWVASVTADALRSQLAGANLAIEQEAKRGGCRQKCLERTKERDGLAAKIAIAEERQTLEKEIAATKRVIASARDKADTTEHKSSATVHATGAIAKTVAFFGAGQTKVSETVDVGTDLGINFAMALAATLVPAFAFYIAGMYRRDESQAREFMATASPTPETMHAAAEHRPTAPLRPIAPHIPAFAAVRRVAAL